VDNHATWNAFVQQLAMTHYDDLTPAQRPAHLVFWYESEVQNGGHLQYFLNRGDAHGEETTQSLHALGADAQARIFQQALIRRRSVARSAPADAQEYAAEALEGEFDDLDQAFHTCPKQLVEVLRLHLAEREAD
jgi:uncharacterized protein DUF4375